MKSDPLESISPLSRQCATVFSGSRKLERRRFLRDAALVLACSAAGSCRPRSPTQNELRAGYVPAASALPLFVALEQRLFDGAGIRVVARQYPQTSEVIQALLAGQLDIACGVGWPTILAAAVDNPTRFRCFHPFYETASAAALAVLKRKGLAISALNELEGKRVGCFPGASMQMFAREILRAANVDVAKVSLIQAPVNAQHMLLESAQIDALITVEPYVTAALMAGTGEMLSPAPRPTLLWTPFPAGTDVAERSWSDAHPDLYRRCREALRSAIAHIRTREPEARAVLPRHAPVEPAIAERISLYLWPERPDVQSVQRLADLLHSHQQLTRPVNVSSMLDD
ncbi:MAG: ABC transporter substrate-binding protein [Kiritimatiellae bacterium]|nr:ABC transporter substrate-binding protein [Kiritimatiellia bacterium]